MWLSAAATVWVGGAQHWNYPSALDQILEHLHSKRQPPSSDAYEQAAGL